MPGCPPMLSLNKTDVVRQQKFLSLRTVYGEEAENVK